MRTMLKLSIFSLTLLFLSCTHSSVLKDEGTGRTVEKVTEFKGNQVTGITKSEQGRLFVNFPRWRDSVTFSVLEVDKQGKHIPYPDERWNAFDGKGKISDQQFMCVQSVVAHKDNLYILDTRNPKFQGVVDQPRVYVFDLKTNKLKKEIKLPPNAYFKNSYINDVRIDTNRNRLYITDSGVAGLIVIDLKSEKIARILTNNKITSSTRKSLVIDGKEWKNEVHSDGIAIDEKNDFLYIHALTSNDLYQIELKTLLYKSPKHTKYNTNATDGMITDSKGNLYLGDLETRQIKKFHYRDKQTRVFIGDKDIVNWPDTFAMDECHLYWTNAKIQEAGSDVSQMTFEVYRTKLDQCL